MTPEKAIEAMRLEGGLEIRGKVLRVTEFMEGLCEAEKALQKQISKKPDIEGDGYDNEGNIIYDTWICPNCKEHYEMECDDYNFCPKCGQAIDTTNIKS